MVNLLVGPVIGHVSANSAIILFEVDEDVETLKCQLIEVGMTTDCGAQNDFSLGAYFHAKRPKVFKFEHLSPNTAYHITIPTISDAVLGVVRTLPEQIDQINIAAVSCDNIYYKADGDMWQTMWERLESGEDQFHILLHIGDNVYIDGGAPDVSNEELVDDDTRDIFNPAESDQSSPYIRARHILEGLDESEWPEKEEEILEIYRNLYRRTFFRTYKRLVMAHTSNLMILDDHEVRDDFGSVPQDSDPSSREFFLGNLAIRVYHEYQRSLWDPEIMNRDETSLKNEFYAMIFGPLGIMMMDGRTVWANNKPKRDEGDTSFYGKEQIQAVKDSLYNTEASFWIMVSPLPLFFLKKKVSELIAAISPSSDDMLSHINVDHRKDLEDLLILIREWREAFPERDLVILSGDVHMGGFTDVHHPPSSGEGKKEELVTRQITTSGINNAFPGVTDFLTLSALLNFTESYGEYTYKHYDWVKECNYAVLSISFFDPTIRYSVKLVHGNKVIQKNPSNKEWDKCSCSASSCLCEIM